MTLVPCDCGLETREVYASLQFRHACVVQILQVSIYANIMDPTGWGRRTAWRSEVGNEGPEGNVGGETWALYETA